jgi:Ala-tRNA(Pro) deacylase
MIPNQIIQYLEERKVPYERRTHRRALTAQEVAAAMHVTGYRVAKSVIVEAGGKTWIAVLPAAELVDEERLAAVLGAPVRFVNEQEFTELFPECEPGAEPPFGGLYGLPVVVDSTLAKADRIVFRAGSHEEALELRYQDFAALENKPTVGTFGRIPVPAPRQRDAAFLP